ncbi:nitrile hydratase subunit alpha [Pseudonocardia humida]|uniref:Nitrile hydratase subunit alpha n=1 Tax=Pseudonocardia humida TaxID=2800819 RepID=A0ABT1A8S1_9PSEU|nr:nitrile hydratase subunit alpha [Pseudonocardia humida]MCO1659313.1 nitrile hydratase subunit alpha [Pseudonocardia humida]
MSGQHASSQTAARVRRLEERLIDAGLTSDDELDGIIGRLLSGASPANGARVVARAWIDPAYRERLLADANAALEELGLSMSTGPQPQRFTVVPNTPDTHNVLVCTLCSCYPIALLGPSPSWYKSEAYRSRVVREPRAVLAEFGLELPAGTGIVVHDTSAESRHMVLPMRPAGTDGLAEDALAALVTREGLIGTAAV